MIQRICFAARELFLSFGSFEQFTGIFVVVLLSRFFMFFASGTKNLPMK